MIFLQSSTFFTTDSSTHANIIMLNGGAVNFGFTERFLIVAVKIKGANEIAMYVSVDGVEFTKSQFPNIGGYSQQGYTIIDSTENSVVVDGKQRRRWWRWWWRRQVV